MTMRAFLYFLGLILFHRGCRIRARPIGRSQRIFEASPTKHLFLASGKTLKICNFHRLIERRFCMKLVNRRQIKLLNVS